MAADPRVYIHAVSPSKSGYAVDEAVTVNAKIKWEDLTANKTIELVLWMNINQSLQGSISRASIINYLNAMVDEELLTYIETTGKGGHHRVYYMKYGETEFKQHIAGLIISKLLKEYPQETRKALQT
jgi:hypothetical protein